MQTVELLLMLGLIVCAVAANFTRRLLPTVIIYAAFDLAITEAAVGVGIDTILFLLALRRMHRIDGTEDEE